MSGVNAVYLPLIERDFDAIPAAMRDYLAGASAEDLWAAVTRFAVLAFAPSLHSKRVLAACRSARELSTTWGARWPELLAECARYAAESRPAWSEPPPLDPPPVDGGAPPADLAEALAAGDRHAAERWLAANLDSADRTLVRMATGETLLLLDSVLALEEPLGGKSRYPLLRTVVWDLLSSPPEPEQPGTLEELTSAARHERGAVDRITAVFVAEAGRRLREGVPVEPRDQAADVPFEPYRLSRDFGQTLIAHAVARRLAPAAARSLLDAVRDNLLHGESFSEWSLA